MDHKLQNYAPPPEHLSDEMKLWWRTVVEDFSMEAHHLHILRLACETYDAAQLARTVIAIAGPTYLDRWGCPRPRPEVAVHERGRRDFARLVRELGFESAPEEAPRPPALRR